MRNLFRNFFVPHQGNNYKAKFLHHSTLVAVIVFLVISTFLLNTLNKKLPQVLGISTDITSEQLLVLLNSKRQESNLSVLNLNPELSAAALNKANDMIAKSYWAHSAPDGRSPWDFIKESGYVYVYAGENLARGFNTSADVTNAWIASPAHKANMLSSNYTDVGFAVVTGKLDGQDTILVVEEFGGRNLAFLPQAQTQNQEIQNPEPSKVTEEKPAFQKQEDVQVVTENPVEKKVLVAPSQVRNDPLIDSINLTRNFSMLLIAVVIAALISEMIILERKKIFSFARHNPDHILFLASVVLLIFILSKGIVL